MNFLRAWHAARSVATHEDGHASARQEMKWHAMVGCGPEAHGKRHTSILSASGAGRAPQFLRRLELRPFDLRLPGRTPLKPRRLPRLHGSTFRGPKAAAHS